MSTREIKVVNLTPHAITLRAGNGSDVLLPSEGVARVSTTPGIDTGVVAGGVPGFSAPSFGAVEGLPAPQQGTLYVVSAIVAARVSGRTDVVSPGTGPADGAIRNDAGQIVAVTRLIAAQL